MTEYCVIFDIDGTLSDPSHRMHLIEGMSIDDLNESEDKWRDFLDMAMHDPPFREIVALNHMAAGAYPVVVCTSRREASRAMTEGWLDQHSIFYSKLMMRKDGDSRPDHEVKREMIESIKNWGMTPLFAVEDRLSNARMFRENGIKCLHVAEGD